jgi:uncharacterized phage protein (TIGR01671 family)
MREIKFRAWDDLNKRMIHSYAKGFNNILSEGDILNRYENIMQFTGLHDKNGKEIYEGDLLRLLETVPSDDPAYPYYCDTMEVCYCEPHCRFGLTDGGAILDIPSNVEVIGNIYENPDLC